MKVVILAAGMATRLRPLTTTLPKCLLPVGGTPLLKRALGSIALHHPEEVVIVTGYLHELIEDFVRSLSLSFPVRCVRNQDFARTNNNYSLWLAMRAIGPTEMILLDADILFDQRILSALVRTAEPDALVIREAGSLGAEEIKVECNNAGYVTKIGKEVDPGLAAGESLGIEKFSPLSFARLLAVLERRKEWDEFYEAAFQEIIDDGARIATVDAGSYACIEIDTEADLRRAEILANDILPVATL